VHSPPAPRTQRKTTMARASTRAVISSGIVEPLAQDITSRQVSGLAPYGASRIDRCRDTALCTKPLLSRAYLGISSNFPNLLVTYGPNTNLAHGGSERLRLNGPECQVSR
jgi:hypothetical protein